MSISDIFDFTNPLGNSGLDKHGEKGNNQSPLLDSAFGEQNKKSHQQEKDKQAKEAGAKEEEKEKGNKEKAKEGENKTGENKDVQGSKGLTDKTTVAEIAKQTNESRQEAVLQASEILHQHASETRAQILNALLPQVFVKWQKLELPQPIQLAQAQTEIPKLPELGNAPAEIQKAYAAKLIGEAVRLEDLAKVNAWLTFNGTDKLSSPPKIDNVVAAVADDSIAGLGRQLVEMKNLIDFNKPVIATPQMDWTKDIQSITKQNGLPAPEQKQILSEIQKSTLSEIIDRKVQTLQAVLQDPNAINQIRNINIKDDKALSTFLAQAEAKNFPTPIVIPSEAIVRNQGLPRAQDALIEQQARAQFTGNNPVNKDITFTQQIAAVPQPLKPGNIAATPETAKAALSKPSDVAAPTPEIAKAIPPKPDNIAAPTSEAAKVALPKPGNIAAPASEVAKAAVPPKPGNIATLAPEAAKAAPLKPDNIATPAPEAAKAIPAALKPNNIVTSVSDAIPVVSAPPKPGIPAPEPEVAKAAPVKPSVLAPAVEPDRAVLSSVSKVAQPAIDASKEAPAPIAHAIPVTGTDNFIQGQTSRAADNTVTVQALSPAAIQQGAPAVAPLETPQFSPSTLNGITSAVVYIKEAFDRIISNPSKANPALTELRQQQFTAANSAPQAITSIDYFRQAQNVSADDHSQTSTVLPALTDYPASIYDQGNNYNAIPKYGNITLPNAFEAKSAERVLTGGNGSTLDGANRGPNAGGSNRNSNVSSSNMKYGSLSNVSRSNVSSKWSPSLSSYSLVSNSSGAILGSSHFAAASNSSASNSRLMGGPSVGAGGRSSSGGAYNPLWGLSGGFTPSWHHGFLNALRSGNIALGINNRSIIKDEDEADKDGQDGEERKQTFIA